MDFNLSSSNLVWNKSLSASDISRTSPLFRRVVIEEQHYPHGQSFSHTAIWQTALPTYNVPSPMPAEGLTRHFSCGQLASSSANCNETFNLTRTHTSTPIRDDNNIVALIQHDSPMDIDYHESTDKADINMHAETVENKPTIMGFVDLTFQGTTPVLRKKSSNQNMPSKYKRNRSKPKHKVASSAGWMCFFNKTSIILFITTILCILLYDKLNYNHDIELEDFKDDLENSLVGQTEAINLMAEALDSFKKGYSSSEKHLLSLIGTNGVGKTLSVNIIKRKFMPKQIVEIDIDTFNLVRYRDYLNLYGSVPYLVVVDDLSYKHMDKLLEILNALPNSAWVLVLAVFNVQDTQDAKTVTINETLFEQIPKELQQPGFVIHHVKFEHFHLDAVKALIPAFSQVYAEVLKDIPNWEDLLVQHDFETYGFKGLFEKMNILCK